MTGLHFVHTQAYYGGLNSGGYLARIVKDITEGKLRGKSLDERLLCKIVRETFGLPPSIPGAVYRPAHGTHFSLHRPVMNWGGTGTKHPNFVELEDTDMWKEGLNVFDRKFVQVLTAFNNHALRLAAEDRSIANVITNTKNMPADEKLKLQKRRSAIRKVKFRFRK